MIFARNLCCYYNKNVMKYLKISICANMYKGDTVITGKADDSEE